LDFNFFNNGGRAVWRANLHLGNLGSIPSPLKTIERVTYSTFRDIAKKSLHNTLRHSWGVIIMKKLEKDHAWRNALEC
jgi:hypothetical protein